MELVFVTGSALRKVYIKDRKISIMTNELGMAPLEIDLDKLDDKKSKKHMRKMKLSTKDKKVIKQLAKLGSEKEIAKDIISDFRKSGWRMVKRNDSG